MIMSRTGTAKDLPRGRTVTAAAKQPILPRLPMNTLAIPFGLVGLSPYPFGS